MAERRKADSTSKHTSKMISSGICGMIGAAVLRKELRAFFRFPPAGSSSCEEFRRFLLLGRSESCEDIT